MRYPAIILMLSFLGLITARWMTRQHANKSQREGEARLHFAEGDRAYKGGDYQLAIEEFEKSYALTSTPLLLFDLAQAHRRKGNVANALSLYHRYLDQAATGPYREIAERMVAELETP